MIEVAIAIGLVGLFVAVLIAMNANLMGLLHSSSETVSASQALQERTEQIRAANWGQITNGDLLVKEIFTNANASLTGLGNAAETITVSPYPANSTIPPVKVTVKDGVAKVLSLNPSLKDQSMVRVDVNLTWNGYPKNRAHTRAATVLFSQTGQKQ